MRAWVKALSFVVLSSLALAASAGCNGFAIPLPNGGMIGINVVTIKLTNTTDWPVDPNLDVDRDEDAIIVVQDENYIRTGLIPPHTTQNVTLDCGRVGTIKSDHAIMQLPGGRDIESDNDPKLTEEDDFYCGEHVEFIFIDDGESFYTDTQVWGPSPDD